MRGGERTAMAVHRHGSAQAELGMLYLGAVTERERQAGPDDGQHLSALKLV